MLHRLWLLEVLPAPIRLELQLLLQLQPAAGLHTGFQSASAGGGFREALLQEWEPACQHQAPACEKKAHACTAGKGLWESSLCCLRVLAGPSPLLSFPFRFCSYLQANIATVPLCLTLLGLPRLICINNPKL